MASVEMALPMAAAETASAPAATATATCSAAMELVPAAAETASAAMELASAAEQAAEALAAAALPDSPPPAAAAGEEAVLAAAAMVLAPQEATAIRPAAQGTSNGQNPGGPGGIAGGAGTSNGQSPGGPGSIAGGQNVAPQPPGTNGDPAAQTTPGNRMLTPDGFVIGQPTAESDRPPPGRSSDAGPGVAPRPGEWQPHDIYPQPDDDDKDAKKQKEKSLAKSRGKDWALRNTNRKSIPFTRAISIQCFPDRLILVPDPGYGDRKEIPLGPRTGEAMDKFIRAIWEQMDAWGMAGSGMYWRPVLQVSVAPGGEGRLADLTVLLKGSGLTIERKM